MLPFADDVQRCRTAQQIWARQPVRERLKPLRSLRRLLVSEADRIGAAVQRDVLRRPDEVLATDILPTADACRFASLSLLSRACLLSPPTDALSTQPPMPSGVWDGETCAGFGSRAAGRFAPPGSTGCIPGAAGCR